MLLEAQQLIRTDFRSFVHKVFRFLHDGQRIGKQSYIDHLCLELEKVISGQTRRLLINLPPRHLKTFLGSVCLAAWTLAQSPSVRIIIVTYNEKLAEHICRDVRKILRASWFKRIFSTRLADDHSRADDFQTTKSGGVYAVSANGALAGRGADLIIFDDPLDLKDWNNPTEIDRVNERFDGMIMSRFNNPAVGRAVIIAHRLNEGDLSAHVLAQGGWRPVILPFIAMRTKKYDLGYDRWRRRKGELLRPDAYSKKEIKRLETQLAPPYDLYYQQGAGKYARIKIKSEHFSTFQWQTRPSTPVVLSIDAAQKSGPGNSYNVIQAWSYDGHNHFLLAQWREQCGYDDLARAYKLFQRSLRPSAVLIEDTANGTALIAEACRKGLVNVVPIVPDGRSKAARLADHIATIRKRRIHLLEGADWRADFVKELIDFPSQFDDQVDAMTQYLAFMATKPELVPPRPRAVSVVINSSGLVSTVSGSQSTFPGIIAGVTSSGRCLTMPEGQSAQPSGPRLPSRGRVFLSDNQ